MIEVLIVVTVVAIVASIVVPMMGNTNSTQLRAAARMLVADLEFAQMASIAHGEVGRVVVFSIATNTYHIGTQSDPATPIPNPVDGKAYAVQFGSGRAFQLPDVSISAISLDGDDQLGFGIYGQLDQSAVATITLAGPAQTVTITLDPTTGEASVGDVI